MHDRAAFNAFVYTPVDEAVTELKRRREDSKLKKEIEKYLGYSLPDSLTEGIRVILHRQVVTPNYEVRRFLTIAESLGIIPLFFEYHDDKFVTENEWKYHLACMSFYHGRGKKGGEKITRKNIINFNEANGKKIRDVKTLWGESLVDFHHDLLFKEYHRVDHELYDGSQWYGTHGKTPKEYYKAVMSLLIVHGVLFENFFMTGSETPFTQDIFLPAFIDAWKRFGHKPLIVALEPTEMESDQFWLCHPPETSGIVEGKLKPPEAMV